VKTSRRYKVPSMISGHRVCHSFGWGGE
jgi:hypothetical protein